MPKYEVKDPAPELETVMAAWRIPDYFIVASSTGACWIYGYVLGKPLRAATASTCATLGSLGALLFIYQRTSWRLMGEIP